MDLIEISDNTKRHPWETARKVIVNKFISTVKKENIKILDVGSGDAYLANSFTKKFSNSYSYCVDTGYNPDIVKEIENTFKNDKLFLYSTLNEVDVKTVDVVTLLDVIEHVPKDVELLTKIIDQPYINESTFFIISVPAYQVLFSQHDVLLKHYRRYSLKKLKETVSQCDFKIIDSGYFFFILIIPRLIQLFREKIASNKSQELGNLGTWKGGKLISAIIKTILLLDYITGRAFKFIGINLPGLSCYVICQRNRTS